MSKVITTLLLVAAASATPMLSDSSPFLQTRQSTCPNLHIFGARETTVPQGFGSSGPVIAMIIAANPGATKEEIFYPAAGGANYSSSARAGVLAVTNQVSDFAAKCPQTQIVLVGYSQGAQIMDDAMCGGGDANEGITNTTAPISAAVASQVKAIILMGDPRHTPGAPYNVGNSTATGFAPRPSGQICTQYANIIQSYCDAADPFCSKGNDPAVHQGYPKEYGSVAVSFVNSKLVNGTGTSSGTSASSTGFTQSSTSGAGKPIVPGGWGIGCLIFGMLAYCVL